MYTSSEVHSRHRQKIKVGRNRAANIDLRQNLSRQLDDEDTVTVWPTQERGLSMFVHFLLNRTETNPAANIDLSGHFDDEGIATRDLSMFVHSLPAY